MPLRANRDRFYSRKCILTLFVLNHNNYPEGSNDWKILRIWEVLSWTTIVINVEISAQRLACTWSYSVLFTCECDVLWYFIFNISISSFKIMWQILSPFYKGRYGRYLWLPVQGQSLLLIFWESPDFVPVSTPLSPDLGKFWLVKANHSGSILPC